MGTFGEVWGLCEQVCDIASIPLIDQKEEVGDYSLCEFHLFFVCVHNAVNLISSLEPFELGGHVQERALVDPRQPTRTSPSWLHFHLIDFYF